MASTENVSGRLEASDHTPAAAATDETTTTTTTTTVDASATTPADISASTPLATSAAAPEGGETEPAATQPSQLEPDNTEGKSEERATVDEPQDTSLPTEEADTAPTETTTTATPEDTTTAATTAADAAEPSLSAVKSSEEPAGSAIAADGESADALQGVKETENAGPALVITLLLTTGARHPFKIDRKYLRRRSVKVDNDDPFNMSVYTLKELIWREWRSEWEPQPSSPSLIRLISFGKLLDDKSPLSESSLTHDAPNVIHMTVKPQEVVDEEDAKGGKSYSARDRETSDRSPSCRCIIL